MLDWLVERVSLCFIWIFRFSDFFEIVQDVQLNDEMEDSKNEVAAAKNELEMRAVADKLKDNQKLLEKNMDELRSSKA